MVRSTFIVVSDDPVTVHKAQQFGQQMGATVEVYSTAQWNEKGGQGHEVPALAFGASTVGEGGKVIQFPGNQNTSEGSSEGRGQVESINQLEARAIENAILAFRGNLTEAAKALGIGRATLYRKVKQYNIDPAVARRKKVA